VFLVLARKAHAVRPPGAVGGWLFGVARRAALEAYAVSRRRRETPVAAVPDRPGADRPPAEADALAALDAEIAALSEPLRAAVVLCELDGLSRREAARRLGVAEGTLSSRLAAARKRLAVRLAARGVTASAALFAASAEVGRAAVPAGPPSAAVSLIARGVMRAMYATKLKLLSIGVLLAAAGLVGLAPKLSRLTAADGPRRVPAARTAPAGKPGRGEGELLLWGKDETVLMQSDGTVVRKWVGKERPQGGPIALSPDGSHVAMARITGTRKMESKSPPGLPVPPPFDYPVKVLSVLPVGDLGGRPKDLPLPGDVINHLFWPAADRLVVGVSKLTDKAVMSDESFATPVGWFDVNPTTGKATKFDLPDGHLLHHLSADAKTLLTRGPLDEKLAGDPGYIIRPGKDWERLTESNEVASIMALSPSGRTVAVGTWGGRVAREGEYIAYRNFDTPNHNLWLVDLASGSRRSVKKLTDHGGWVWCRWSPDGRKLGYMWQDEANTTLPIPGKPFPDPPKFVYHLAVCDADGQNAKESYSGESIAIDWR
jgi:hypothetical protein